MEAGSAEAPVAVLAQQYSKENPDVTFDVEPVPNEQYGEVLRTQLQGGNAPDVFYVTGGQGNPHSALPLAEAGYLVDLSKTVAKDLYTDQSRFLGEFDGKIWTQPYDFVPVTNNYNLTVAKELGIDLPFKSVDDVLDACGVAQKAGKSLLRLAGSTVPNNGLTTLQLAATRVYSEDPDWNEKRLKGDVTFADTKGWTESLELIVKMYKEGCFQQGAEAGVIADNVPAIAAGTAVGGFAPGGQIGDLRRVNPDNEYVSTAFPGDKGEKYLFASPSNMLALNASSDKAKQKAGLAFLAWLAEPEHADALAEVSGNLSIRAGAGAELPDQYQFISDYFSDENYQPLGNLQWPSPEIYNTLGTGVQGLLTGQTDVESVLKAMDAAWDQAAG
ncbi:ABC transporter substrate-binding protein [Naasia aerilata]|uniref:Sugar-binding protein n=1 Tax=Naasia aerilata TaxID=1162966 RepID=A0ABM8G7I9_9MICO|nr:extracellular solute-binding protein [Naasia aerilata]BDZ44130.1 sugar-binding protein [Naasia aerilata]